MTRGYGRLHLIGEHEAGPYVNRQASYRLTDLDREGGS
jgi:hypothetical protein